MAPAGILIPDAPPADLFTMPPDQIVRALYWDDAMAEAILAAPLSPEAAAQAERDAAAFAKYAAEPFLHNPDLPPHVVHHGADARHHPEVDAVIPRPQRGLRRGDRRRAAHPRCGHALYFELLDLVADEIAFLTDVPAAS